MPQHPRQPLRVPERCEKQREEHEEQDRYRGSVRPSRGRQAEDGRPRAEKSGAQGNAQTAGNDPRQELPADPRPERDSGASGRGHERDEACPERRPQGSDGPGCAESGHAPDPKDDIGERGRRQAIHLDPGLPHTPSNRGARTPDKLHRVRHGPQADQRHDVIVPAP